MGYHYNDPRSSSYKYTTECNDWSKKHPNLIKIKEILGLSRYNDWLIIEQGSNCLYQSCNYEDMEKKAKKLIKEWSKNEKL